MNKLTWMMLETASRLAWQALRETGGYRRRALEKL
jgi:hypothetical protein